jgi:hypothetical protein
MQTVQASVSKGWLHKEGNFSFPEEYYFDPLFRWERDRAADLFVANRFPDLPIYNMESNLVQAEYFEPNQILIGGIQPNMLLGMAVGAQLTAYYDKDADIDSKPFETFNSVADLPDPKSLLQSETMRLFDSQLEAIKKDRPDLDPIPPFFWDSSGRACIHGPVTTAQKLFGENVFMMILDDPKGFAEIMSWITEVYIILIKHYSSLADLSISSIHIGECSGAMIGPEQFSNAITPSIDKLAEEFNSVRIHSCGHSDHLIEPFSKITNLAIIDTGTGTSVAKIRSAMGNAFEINIAPPVECLTKAANEDSMTAWLDETMEQNARGPLSILFHIEPDYSMERCLQVFEYLKDRGASVSRTGAQAHGVPD